MVRSLGSESSAVLQTLKGPQIESRLSAETIFTAQSENGLHSKHNGPNRGPALWLREI